MDVRDATGAGPRPGSPALRTAQEIKMTASVFAAVQMAPRDPILGVTETFNADTNPNKVNLGVGVYTDDNGKVPLLDCVRRAEQQLVASALPRTYLPIDGLPAYDRAVQALVFGADSPAIAQKRVVTVQALGGTGGLKVGADFLRRIAPGRPGLDQRSELGESSRAVRERRLHRQHAIPTTTRPRTASISTRCWLLWNACRPARSSCCTPAATTRPAWICRRRSGTP